jgi:hypothetical protein
MGEAEGALSPRRAFRVAPYVAELLLAAGDALLPATRVPRPRMSPQSPGNGVLAAAQRLSPQHGLR